MIRSAVISPDGLYRYDLQRSWGDVPTRAVAFIGLNPSKADSQVDDATARVMVGYAKRWGYDRLIVRNLFAYRATDPTELLQVSDPVGPEGDEWLARSWADARLVVACWGVGGLLAGRELAVRHMIEKQDIQLYALGLTKSGHPVHPLRQRRELIPRRWPLAA